jgi:hypothetical protein
MACYNLTDRKLSLEFRIWVLVVVNMQIAAYWAVTPYALVRVIFLNMGPRRSSGTSVNFYQTVQCNIAEDSTLYCHLSSLLIAVQGIFPKQLKKTESYFSFSLYFLFEPVFCLKW